MVNPYGETRVPVGRNSWVLGGAALNYVVAHAAAHNLGFKAEQKAAAEKVAEVVRAHITPHNKAHQLVHSVKVKRRNRTDLAVVVDDPNVWSIEFGHDVKNKKDGPVLGYAEGLHLVRNAAIAAGGVALPLGARG